MLIRKATPADIAQAARNAITALPNDEIDEFLYPYRREHPAAYLAGYRKSIGSFASGKHRYLIVAELEPDDPAWKGKKEIVGHVEWFMEVDDSKDNVFERMWKALAEFVGNIRHHFSALTNPAASIFQSMAFDTSPSAVKYFSKEYKDPKAKWGIADIIVSPDYQKQGVGMKLLEWGMGRARKDRVPIVLEATRAGRRLYEKAGFVGIGTWRWGKEKHMTSLTMRWDPPSSASIP